MTFFSEDLLNLDLEHIDYHLSKCLHFQPRCCICNIAELHFEFVLLFYVNAFMICLFTLFLQHQ